MDPGFIDPYLERIGARRPAMADLDSLRELQFRHLLTVPFENLSVHLGEPIVLEEGALIHKLVARRRGGFCYELNGAFCALLRALDFRVTRLSARVLGPEGRTGPPFDHMCLRVDLEEAWLVDVGFGAFSQYPLRLDSRAPQLDPAGTFELVERELGDIDTVMNGVPQYRLEARPRQLDEYRATCWWHQTSPLSHFTQNLVCSRQAQDGRITLSGTTLVTTRGDRREERVLRTDDEVLAAFRDEFGIVLDRVPALRPPAAP